MSQVIRRELHLHGQNQYYDWPRRHYNTSRTYL